MEVGTSFQEWQFSNSKKKIILSKYRRNEKEIRCKRWVVLPDFETKECKLYWRVFEREELLDFFTKAGLKLTHECYILTLVKKVLGNLNLQDKDWLWCLREFRKNFHPRTKRY